MPSAHPADDEGRANLPAELHLIATAAIGAATSLVTTPVAISFARRHDFCDRPVGYKAHQSPTPYLGGAAVLCGFLLAVPAAGDEIAHLAPIVAAAAIVWALGTFDDRNPLPWQLRVAVETSLAATLWITGLGWGVIGIDALDLALTVIWVVCVVNAFNLMDNMDGATATVGGVSALAVAGMALVKADVTLAALCVGLAGACLGFLPHNLARPARVFLGDGGSLSIGLVISASIMALPTTEAGTSQILLAAVLLAGLPLVDTTLVMVSRLRAGVPLLSGGRDHITWRLATRLGSPRHVAVALGSIQAVLGAIAIGAVQLDETSIIVGWAIWLVAIGATIAILERRSWAPVRDWLVP